MNFFQTRFLKEADKFVSTRDEKENVKLFYNIDLAE